MGVRKIQIVAFDNPYPPDYGGAIDVFFKIKALSQLGLKVYLHFFYTNRKDISGLKAYCTEIYMYKQDRSISRHFSLKPFSTKSRVSNILKWRVKSIGAPVLLESLRCCDLLDYKDLKQNIAVRCHNIEYSYSWGIAKSEKNFIVKLAHYIEGYKQKLYAKTLNKANVLFSLSISEENYFSKHYYPKSVYLPVFHGRENIISKDGYGKYALYHGDLSIADNLKSAEFLISVFEDLPFPLIIAGSSINKRLSILIRNLSNVTFKKIDENEQLQNLIENAHINTLYSLQKSGTKLKVFNALFNGRHCLVNDNVVDDANILSICKVANTLAGYKEEVKSLFEKEFKLSEERISVLKLFKDIENAKIIIKNLF